MAEVARKRWNTNPDNSQRVAAWPGGGHRTGATCQQIAQAVSAHLDRQSLRQNHLPATDLELMPCGEMNRQLKICARSASAVLKIHYADLATGPAPRQPGGDLLDASGRSSLSQRQR